MAQTSINIRIDEDLKQNFEAVCGEIGLTMTAAFNVFAKTVTARKEIPFKLAINEEWGHLSKDNLLSVEEAAGAAGEWDDTLNIPIKRKSAWAEAAIKKEIRNYGKASDKKRSIKHGTIGH